MAADLSKPAAAGTPDPPNTVREGRAGASRACYAVFFIAMGGAAFAIAVVWLPYNDSDGPRQSHPQSLTLDLGDGVTMDFVLVPAGGFTMGSPEYEKKRHEDEGPQHQVEISLPYYLGKYEVTQEQYEKIAGKNPSLDKGANLPVDRVSWHDAMTFCQMLGTVTGRIARLPTEAEWEYACRAGATTPFHHGKTLGAENAQFHWCFPYDAAPSDLGPGGPAEVGSFPANAWGLHDMHGNVYEWCFDRYDPGYYAKSPTLDPSGPSSGEKRVARGGSWNCLGNSLRAAHRGGVLPTTRKDEFGFRVLVYDYVPES